MRAQVVTAALVSLLIVATAILGITFEGGGNSGASATTGKSVTSNEKAASLPHLVVFAQIVAPKYLLESVNYSPGSGYGAPAPPIPEYMLSPVSGLKLTLTSDQPAPTLRGGTLPKYDLYTNESGLAESLLPAGNYTVEGFGDTFNYTGSIDLVSNATTYLGLTVYPKLTNVTSVEVVNQDLISQVEPSGTIFIEVPGTFHYTPGAFYQLLEPSAGITLGGAAVNGVLKGEYASPDGTWVIMDPQGGLQPVPTAGAMLMHYATSSLSFRVSGNNTVTFNAQ